MVEADPQLPEVPQVERIGLGQVTHREPGADVAAVDPATYRRFTPAAVRRSSRTAWDRVAGGELAITGEAGEAAAGQGRATSRSATARTPPVVHVGCLRTAGHHHRHGRQHGVGRRPRPDGLRQRPADLHRRRGRRRPSASRSRGSWARTRRCRTSTSPRGSVSTPMSCRPRSSTGGSIAQRGRHVQLHRPRRRPDRARPGVGRTPTSPPRRCRSWAASPATSRSSPSCAPRSRRSSVAGCPTRSTPASTPAATTRASSPASTTLSNHSFGLALDLNVPGNQRGTVGEIDREVVAIFKKWGFAWGGDWRYTDPMHFELGRDRRPALGSAWRDSPPPKLTQGAEMMSWASDYRVSGPATARAGSDG